MMLRCLGIANTDKGYCELLEDFSSVEFYTRELKVGEDGKLSRPDDTLIPITRAEAELIKGGNFERLRKIENWKE